MADTYITLVNKLRRRFNEVDLTAGTTWSTAVGFDQFTKDAINYAYHDILDSAMEWPFLHQSATITTTPGIQFYTPSLTAPSGFTSPAELKEIDWDGFYINTNETVATISNEVQTIPSTSPYNIATINDASWQSDLGVIFNIGSTALTAVTGDPGAGEYTILNGQYYFNVADIAKVVKISYLTAVATLQAGNIDPSPLRYIDYDVWRQAFLSRDIGALRQAQGLPCYVFKTQVDGQIGITPVPDKIYQIKFEYWIDGLDLSNTTDTLLIPSRFNTVLLDGATMYLHRFREDGQMATSAEQKFLRGISRMRTELINRPSDMQTGFRWRSAFSSWVINSVGSNNDNSITSEDDEILTAG